jgi:hypothetical protein
VKVFVTRTIQASSRRGSAALRRVHLHQAAWPSAASLRHASEGEFYGPGGKAEDLAAADPADLADVRDTNSPAGDPATPSTHAGVGASFVQ